MAYYSNKQGNSVLWVGLLAIRPNLVENGQSVGPMTAGQMVEMASAGRLRPDTLVWMAGMPDWVAAAQLPQLAGLFAQTPPPPPTQR